MIRNVFRAFLYFLIIAVVGCSGEGQLLFSKMDRSETGISFSNNLQENEDANVLNYSYFYNGGGVAIGDINNDGLPDILFTGNMVPNRLYLNEGNLRFRDISESAGINKAQGWCTGATMVDINNDGWLDIYICRSADILPAKRKNLLYINNRKNGFTEQAAEYGVDDAGYSTQAVFFDCDKDGDLDLFVANHSLKQYANEGIENPVVRKTQQPEFSNRLYVNEAGKFRDVSEPSGIRSNVLNFGLGLVVSDFNSDSWPDIYVTNDFNEPDYYYVNNGDGTFKESLSAGMDEASLFSMGCDAADYDNDGLTDLVTLDMLPEDNMGQKMHNGAENFDKFRMLLRNGFYYQSGRNMLHKNNGDGTFSEIGRYAGVSATDWSWSALFCDFDNDGAKDLYISNGYFKDYTDMDFIKYSIDRTIKQRSGEATETVTEYISKMPAIVLPDYLYKNTGEGRFEKINDRWGIQENSVSAGAAYADLDNDGDMDLVISNVNDYAGIYRNDQNGNSYLKVITKGDAKNNGGIGAKVKVYQADRIFFQEQFPVRGFQSSVDQVLNFGLGTQNKIDSIMIVWPDERVQVVKQVATNQTITLDISNAVVQKNSIINDLTETFFVQDSILDYTHREDDLNDFTIQPLLPHFLSRSGPFIVSGDLDADGMDELCVGGGVKQSPSIWKRQQNGQYTETNQPALKKDSLYKAVSAVFFDANGDGHQDLYVVSGGYGVAEGNTLLQDKLYLNNGKGSLQLSPASLPEMLTSKSCVKPYDVDGDGDLDLFVGGRVVPGRYPLAPRSYYLINDGSGKFTDMTDALAPHVKYCGMVTDAAWMDMTEDGKKDLVIIGEWMEIKVNNNIGGKLIDIGSSHVPFSSSGWWNTLAIADIDNDGDEDLVLGNIGQNTIFTATEKRPVELFVKDFDGNGSVDPVLCYYFNNRSYPMASRDDLTDQLPFLRKKFLEYHSYANASISDLFTTEQMNGSDTMIMNMASSVYLENGGNRGFAMHQLPLEAQWSPVYAIAVHDVNHDGAKDVILAGNNTWSRVKFGNYRANHGFLFLGNGKGDFTHTSKQQSGLNLRKEVRSLATLRISDQYFLLAGINESKLKSYKFR